MQPAHATVPSEAALHQVQVLRTKKFDVSVQTTSRKSLIVCPPGLSSPHIAVTLPPRPPTVHPSPLQTYRTSPLLGAASKSPVIFYTCQIRIVDDIMNR